jgi:hypothetical protein
MPHTQAIMMHSCAPVCTARWFGQLDADGSGGLSAAEFAGLTALVRAKETTAQPSSPPSSTSPRAGGGGEHQEL